MKRLLGMARICATFGLVLSASAQEPLPEELEVVIVPGGQNLLVWQGQDERTYFVQASDPDEPAGHLSSWLWMPVIDYGTGVEISHEVGADVGRAFFRIWYTDAEWPDGMTLEEWDADGDGLSNAAEIDEDLQTNPV